MTDALSWIATVATILAALMVASNLGPRLTGFGFVVFALGSVAWFMLGIRTGQPALIWTDSIMTLLNLFGVWRWLGQRAKLEDGSRAAAAASEKTPGESLFPISLLTSAKVCSGTSELGRCVDAMAGSMSGKVDYVVVGEGGVAGVGETFRRMPWTAASVVDGTVRTPLDRSAFEKLEAVPKDDWPAS